MSIQVKVYDNGDHTCIVWLPSDLTPIPNCRGFTVKRDRIRDGKSQSDYLHGFVGFSDGDKLDLQNPWKFPVQRFMWWDYGVQIGDVVKYTVIPVVGTSSSLSLDLTNASTPTADLNVTGQCGDNMEAYFNKGVVAAQWVSKALSMAPAGTKISNLVSVPGNSLREALSGLLRPKILELLSATKDKGGKVYAALYELDDKELIDALTSLGDHCHLILASGAFNPPSIDENADVRAQLKANTKIDVIDRLVKGSHFGHNKFVVFCDENDQPETVLTGSTNWTVSGLCTQANNGLVIHDQAVAANYLAAWQRLKAAGSGYTPELIDGNSTTESITVGNSTVTPWFACTSKYQDLEDARKHINAAQEGILFLFFNPGKFQEEPQQWTLLQNILERHNQNNPDIFNPDLFFCGVVNQNIPQLTTVGGSPSTAVDPSNPSPSPVTLYRNGIEPPEQLGHDVLVPHNVKTQFHDWEKELLGASMVNIHSKVIVIDPFGAKPVVITGSHNLGPKASHENDDNMVIIEGNNALAAAYAVNIVAIFQTYRWNSYVENNRQNPNVWHGLADNDSWQATYLKGQRLKELEFWLGQDTPAAASAQISHSTSS